MLKRMRDRKQAIRSALDEPEIGEVREAIRGRISDLKRLGRKADALGLDTAEITGALGILEGDDARPGLLEIMVPERYDDDAGQADAFFDADAPEAEVVEEPEPEPERAEKAEAEVGAVPFVPRPGLIEEARAYLRGGWPEPGDEPEGELGETIRLVREYGWTKVHRMAGGEPEVEPEAVQEDEAGGPPKVGDVVKMAANRRYKFRVHSVHDDHLTLEDFRGRELRPYLNSVIEWDSHKDYWVVIDEEIAPEIFAPVGVDGGGEEEAVDEPEPESSEEARPEAAFVGLPDVGDPLVVQRGHDDLLFLVGPIAVMPPHVTRIVDPDSNAHVGNVKRDRIQWDPELEAWTVPHGLVQWIHHQNEATTTH